VQTKQQIQALLDQIHSYPRRQFGQNFMIDGNLLRLVAAAGNVAPQDLVIEVGPGTGSLTEELLSTGAGVIAVEIDRDLAELLRQRLGQRTGFKLIESDALAGKHSLSHSLQTEIAAAVADGKTVKLVANLPYQIASPLVIEMLVAGVALLAFTVQKEVGLRLKAPAGSEHYGPLSVMAQLLAKVEILRAIPPQAFWPMPKIESALVRMTRQDELGLHAGQFTRFLHGVFSYRRKMLRKGLIESSIAEAVADQALARTGFDPRLRPEELSPSQWLALFHAINAVSAS
jgi:16S rRNA (adenine1518-N6/adenine1519-N6)-dimethyltransferase